MAPRGARLYERVARPSRPALRAARYARALTFAPSARGLLRPGQQSLVASKFQAIVRAE